MISIVGVVSVSVGVLRTDTQVDVFRADVLETAGVEGLLVTVLTGWDLALLMTGLVLTEQATG